jgi:NADPH2:quinone reductase
MKAIRVHQHGGPEALVYDEVPQPQPQAGEVLVQVEAIGINFIDIYRRAGAYAMNLPFTVGDEIAGTVVALGEGVTEFAVGDRVATANAVGAYAEFAIVPVSRTVPIPADLDSRKAAAAMLQGLTAHYLAHSTYPIKQGDSVLVHAAAGGVGLLLVQMAKRLGARVFATVSTEEKAELACQAGADEVILYTQTDFEAEVKRLTDGAGLHAVYDSVGKTTFDKSINCLRPRGTMVLFGQSSGAVDPVNPQILNAKGSLFLTRPTLAHYTLTREELLVRTSDLFNWIASGELQLRIDSEFPLSQAGAAQSKLESRGTTGKVLLIPDSQL